MGSEVDCSGVSRAVWFINRPPNHRLDDFLSTNNELLGNISRENKISFVMGDFLTSQFLDGMYSNVFFPLITRPSRIASNTATLIDNIFANNFFEHLRSC